MINITCLILLSLLIAVLLVAIVMIPVYILKQNKKSFEFLQQNLELTRLQLQENSKVENSKVLNKVTLQAFERLILFLERIKPANLVTRLMQPQLTTFLFTQTLLSTIKEEFEHNMSQQLYVSNAVWDQVKTAKEDVVMLINTSSGKLKRGDPAADLAKEILTAGFENKTNPIDKALNAIKEELTKNFK